MFICTSLLSIILTFFATLPSLWITCIDTRNSLVFIHYPKHPMAPPTFLASTPTSRRNRRKLQKQRRRARQATNCGGLWRDKTGKASDEPRDWLLTAFPDEHKAAAECVLPKAYTFEPDLSRNFSTGELISQYRKDLLTSKAPNPFSFLDVQIPSPTLSLPLSPQVASVQQSADQGHDVHDIGFSTAMGLPTPPPESVIHRNIRQDE